MKNIHVLPTDKLSKLYYHSELKQLVLTNKIILRDVVANQNIYITSDEEIKEGDWCLDSSETIVVKCLRTASDSYWNKNCKKIILTTDQDLIKDNIQAVPDDFLEYFVGVPFGEIKEIEVEWIKTPDGIFYHQDNVPYGCYKIIIPKEDTISTKDRILSETPEIIKKKVRNTANELVMKTNTASGGVTSIIVESNNLVNNQELFEYLHNELGFIALESQMQDIEKIILKQQERSYSEKEVVDLLRARNIELGCYEGSNEIEKWFEQFKKK